MMRPKSKPATIIPPLSIVKVTSGNPAWKDDLGLIFRVGYYSKQDGLDCVWLVDDTGKYVRTADQEMINNHFGILKLSSETDLFGEDRPIIGPRVNDAKG
jgi:hypothetical protein